MFGVTVVGAKAREYSSKIVPLGEKHLRKMVLEFIDYYRERNVKG